MNNINLSVVCALACQKLQVIQVSMTFSGNQVEQKVSVSSEDTKISCDKCSSSEHNTWLGLSVSASSCSSSQSRHLIFFFDFFKEKVF